MENRTHAIVVGVFALLFGFGLVFSFWWLNGAQQELNYYTVISKQPVTGLVAESVVKFRGVAVGKVREISLAPDDKTTVLVKIRLPQSLKLSKETVAELRPQGVTGLAYIDLNDTSTTAPTLKDGDSIMLQASIVDKLLERGPAIVAELETLLKTSNEAVANTNQIIKSMNSGDLNKSLANVEQASRQLEPLLVTASKTMERISTMASEKNQAQIRSTLASMQKTADNFQPLLTELGATSKEYRELASNVKQGTTQLTETLNYETMPKLHSLTQNVNYDVRSLGQVIDMLEDNPQSIIFGNPAVRPGPGEAGFKH